MVVGSDGGGFALGRLWVPICGAFAVVMVGLLSVVWVLWPLVVGFDMSLDLLWVDWILWSMVGGFDLGLDLLLPGGGGGCRFCYGGGFDFLVLGFVVVDLIVFWYE